MMRRLFTIFCLCFVAHVSRASDEKSPTIFSASSLESSLNALFEPESDVTLVFGSSATMARQVASGAPADIFLSANVEWADWLSDEVSVYARRAIIGNQLVLAARDPDICPTDLIALSARSDFKIVIGEPNTVPLGQYTKESLNTLGFWQLLETDFIPSESARSAARFVETGNVDFGILYKTDAIAFPEITICFELPPESHAPIVYEALLLSESPQAQEVYESFFDARAAVTFAASGFQTAYDGTLSNTENDTESFLDE